MSSCRRASSATSARDQVRHIDKRLASLRNQAFRSKVQLNKEEGSQWAEKSKSRAVRPQILDQRGNGTAKQKMRPRQALQWFYMQVWKIWVSQEHQKRVFLRAWAEVNNEAHRPIFIIEKSLLCLAPVRVANESVQPTRMEEVD